jgi:hypothetical protein
MTPEERQLLNGLFERIGNAADAPRDRDAEAFINDQVRARPYAPYLLAQTVIIQEEALKAAASRIQELESQQREQEGSSGGFLGGLGKTIFGSGEQRPTTVPRTGSASAGAASAGPWGAQRGPVQGDRGPAAGPASGPWGARQAGAGGGFGGFGGGGGGGGFLRGAMTTAAGVAGGALLYQGISSLFSGQHGSGLLSEAQGLTDQASGLGSDLFGKESVLGGAQPAAAEEPAAEDPGIQDAGYDAGYDDGGDAGGDDWV